MQKISFIIPFHRLYSRPSFVRLIENLLESNLGLIVLVDDASGGIYDSTLETLQHKTNLKILKHAVISGYGASIKTALNYVYCNHRDCIGTIIIDPNQEYSYSDVLRLTQEFLKFPADLIQGVTKEQDSFAFSLLIGIKMKYLGAGIRALPMEFILKCLKIRSNYYDFDIDLILLCKFNNVKIREILFENINQRKNLQNFNPFLFSMKIGFVLFRFLFVSLITAAVDMILFVMIYSLSSSIALGMLVSRGVAMMLNYRLIKRRVFYTQEKNYQVMCKYLMTVLFFGLMSFFLINILRARFLFSVISAKILVESTLFLFNLLVQRDIVFVSDSRYEKTDWDRYYENPFPSARLTRKIMERQIIGNINKFSPSMQDSGKIIELGGANSCFLNGVFSQIRPKQYSVADNNKVGLQKLKNRIKDRKDVVLIDTDIFDLSLDDKADVAFSVGLIEHFSPEGTRKVINVHFNVVKPGGIVLLTFPTSTWLYHCTRFFSELLGIWIFTDERPLQKNEVLDQMSLQGKVLYNKTIWSMFLTQTVVIAKKY